MLFIQTVEILVEAADESDADTKVQAIFESIEESSVLDFQIKQTEEAANELVDAIANHTYTAGDFCKDWLLFSEKAETLGFGYYNTSYGWVDKNLATRFAPVKGVSDGLNGSPVLLLED